MTLRHLEIFSAVCAQESFTRAAEQLNMAQPAVSLAIRELEALRLITSTTCLITGERKYAITDAGRVQLTQI